MTPAMRAVLAMTEDGHTISEALTLMDQGRNRELRASCEAAVASYARRRREAREVPA